MERGDLLGQKIDWVWTMDEAPLVPGTDYGVPTGAGGLWGSGGRAGMRGLLQGGKSK